MENQQRNEKYKRYVEAKIPKTKIFPSLIYAFVVGGLICCFGQIIYDSLHAIFPVMSETDLGTSMLIIIIFLTCFFTAIGIFDQLGEIAGAGTIIPITGFANSIASPALEYKREGIIFGVCVKMFTVAGPVIVSGIVASYVVGLIYLFLLL